MKAQNIFWFEDYVTKNNIFFPAVSLKIQKERCINEIVLKWRMMTMKHEQVWKRFTPAFRVPGTKPGTTKRELETNLSAIRLIQGLVHKTETRGSSSGMIQ